MRHHGTPRICALNLEQSEGSPRTTKVRRTGRSHNHGVLLYNVRPGNSVTSNKFNSVKKKCELHGTPEVLGQKTREKSRFGDQACSTCWATTARSDALTCLLTTPRFSALPLIVALPQQLLRHTGESIARAPSFIRSLVLSNRRRKGA